MVTGTLRVPLESGLATSPVLALYQGPVPGKYTARLSAPASRTGATCSSAAHSPVLPTQSVERHNWKDKLPSSMHIMHRGFRHLSQDQLTSAWCPPT